MKILHVINSLVRGGGAEALVLALATALNKIEGNVVHVLSLENPKDKEYAQLLEAQGVRCFVLSHQMRSFRNIQLLSDFIQEHDYDIINVHLSFLVCGGINPKTKKNECAFSIYRTFNN